MAQRTDTKAIEQANNESLINSTSDNLSPVDRDKILLDSCYNIALIAGGGDEFTLSSVCRQLCKITDYMLPYKEQDLNEAQIKLDAAEDAKAKDVAGAQGRIEWAKDLRDEKKEIRDDVAAFHKAARENFFYQTGQKYAPTPPKSAKIRRPSREERLAKVRA